MTLALALALLAAFAPPAAAQAYMPYPEARISAEQWQGYLDLVTAAHGATEEHLDEQQLVLFTDNATSTHYAFTLPGNPAHPAWITRQIVEIDGRLHIRQVGYFAGEEEPFAQLFQAYQELNEQMREELERQQSGSH